MVQLCITCRRVQTLTVTNLVPPLVLITKDRAVVGIQDLSLSPLILKEHDYICPMIPQGVWSVLSLEPRQW